MNTTADKKKIFEKQIVVFSVAKEDFGVDINEVREIIKVEEVTKIPNAKNYIEGVINLRGKIVVIVDLGKKIKLPESKTTKDTRIIVVESGSNIIGMVVDSCNEVIRLNTEQIEEAPDMIKEKIGEDFIKGVAILKDRLIILLDLMKVLSDDDLAKISTITDK